MLNFVKPLGSSLLALHVVKVFFADPCLKMWWFSMLKDDAEQPCFRIDTAYGHILRATMPHVYPGEGIVLFILARVLPQPSRR